MNGPLKQDGDGDSNANPSDLSARVPDDRPEGALARNADLRAILGELLADADPEVRADAEELIEIWYSK
jgi:hypothetical protein